MKNKKLLAVAALTGLTFGALSVTAASAQGYGGDESPAPTAEAADNDSGSIVLVQDAETPDAEDGESERQGRRGRGGCNLDEAAEAIGIDEAELRAALDEGDTIADVAEANGVAVDDVIDAMVDAKTEKIESKVEAGRITQDEADDKLAELEDRIADRVNGVDDDAAEA